MVLTNIDSAEASALAEEFLGKSNLSEVETYQVEEETTDASEGDKEFRYRISEWNEYLGYYKHIPELKIAVDTKANWVVGIGFQAEPPTTLLLGGIKGNGKDSFNTILENMERVCYMAGDSFAEVIRDDDEVFVNLKPLDPSSIDIISNAKGIIIRYEQVDKHKKPIKTFKPEEIFHMSNDRAADEVHGISIIPAVKWVINARNESMSDWKRVLHRNVAPWFIFHLGTDDTTEIAAFKAKNDAARASGENMYVPKGVVEPEQVATAQNSTLNPLTWIEKLNDYFYQAVGVPQIIVGNAKEFTDASSKIVYLAFEQRIKGRQLYVEEQVLGQLNLEINLVFPASLQQEALSDQPNMELEEEPTEPAAQPNDTTEEIEGAT